MVKCVSADYYSILGISEHASRRQIRAAFRKNALLIMEKIIDPTLESPAPFEKELIQLTAIFEVLQCPEKRQVYDNLGDEGLKQHMLNPTNVRIHSHLYYQNFALFDDDENIALMDFHTWNQHRSSTDAWLILFYSSSYAYTEEFSWVFRTAARRLTDIMHVAVVDCEDRDSFPICHNLQIRTLPTVLLYPFGAYNIEQRPYLFQGAQTLENFVEFALYYQPMYVQRLNSSHFLDKTYPLLPFDGTRGSSWVLGFCRRSGVDRCGFLTMLLKEIHLITKSLLQIGHIECGLSENAKLCNMFKISIDESTSATPIEEEIPDVDSSGKQSLKKPIDSSGKDSFLFVITKESTDVDLALSQMRLPDNAHSLTRQIFQHLSDLPQISYTEFRKIASNSISSLRNPDKVKHAKTGEEKTYLIFLISEAYCPRVVATRTDESHVFTLCETTRLNFREVHTTLSLDPNYKDKPLYTVVFDCYPQVYDALIDELCKSLKIQQHINNGIPYTPELIMLRDQALNPHRFHYDLTKSDMVFYFIQESYKSPIHSMTQDDFRHHVIEEKQTWYVFFYTSWCQECRHVFPNFNEASLDPELPEDVNFGKVDCAEHNEICVEHHVKTYPIFLLFVNGTRHQFDYDFMTAREFVRFLVDWLHPVVREYTPDDFRREVYDPISSQHILKITEFEDTTEHFPPTEERIINFFAPWCEHCHSMAPIFESAAKTLRGVMQFGKMNCELENAFCQHLGIQQYPTILRYAANPFERNGSLAEFQSDNHPDPKKVLEFAVKDVHNFIILLDYEKFKQDVIASKKEVSWIVLFTTDKCNECEEIRIAMKAVAARFQQKTHDKIKAARSHGDESLYEEWPTVNLHVGEVNCRQSGLTYTLCLEMKIKNFPMLFHYSGIRRTKTKLRVSNWTKINPSSEIVQFTEELLQADRKAYFDPLRRSDLVREANENYFQPNLKMAAHFFLGFTEKTEL